MESFVECIACDARASIPGDAGVSDFERLGWSFGPTLCPEHVGLAAEHAALAPSGDDICETCGCGFDPTPDIEACMAISAQARAASGRRRFRPRDGFCQIKLHCYAPRKAIS